MTSGDGGDGAYTHVAVVAVYNDIVLRPTHACVPTIRNQNSVISHCQRSFNVSIGLDEASCPGAGGPRPG